MTTTKPLRQTLINAMWERLWHNCDKATANIVFAYDEPEWDEVDLDSCIDHLEQALLVARTLKKLGERCDTSSSS